MTTATIEQTQTLPTVSKADERQLVRGGAQKWTKVEVSALRELCCPKDATPAEILAFWYVCKRTGLDPFARQIYLVRYGAGEDEEGRGRATIQIGIDGFRQVSMETPGFAGIDEPEFEGEGTEKDKNGNDVKHPLICRVIVYRMFDGQRVKFVGVARWKEFAKHFPERDPATKRPTGKKFLGSMWAAMPFNQLAKCAEAQAHRKSAPMRLSGVYAPEEIGTVIDVVGTPIAMPQARAALTQQPAAGQTNGGEVKTGKDLWNKLMDYIGGNEEEAANLLEKLTAFQGSKGPVKGVRDWKKLSDAWAQKTYQKFQDLLKQQG